MTVCFIITAYIDTVAMVKVPTKSSVTGAAKSGAGNGLPAGIGAFAGKRMFGSGIGTAVGGIAGASTLEGQARDRLAETAVFVGAAEAASGGSSRGSSRGRM